MRLDRCGAGNRKALGALTHEIIEREIRDWERVKIRRLSRCLIKCAWRLLLKQPDYWLVKKWSPVLLKGGVQVPAQTGHSGVCAPVTDRHLEVEAPRPASALGQAIVLAVR